MADSTERTLIENGKRRVKFKGEEDMYEFSLLSVRQVNAILPKFLGIISPIVAAGWDTFSSYSQQVRENDEDLGFKEESLDLSFISLATIFGNQMFQPEVNEFLDSLVVDLKKNGKEISLDDAFRGEYDKYLKLIELAFKDNLKVPLVRLLEEKGYAGMLTSLQAAMSGAKELMKGSSQKD